MFNWIPMTVITSACTIATLVITKKKWSIKNTITVISLALIFIGCTAFVIKTVIDLKATGIVQEYAGGGFLTACYCPDSNHMNIWLYIFITAIAFCVIVCSAGWQILNTKGHPKYLIVHIVMFAIISISYVMSVESLATHFIAPKLRMEQTIVQDAEITVAPNEINYMELYK